MKRLRHRLGRWLLRDAGEARRATLHVNVVPDARKFSAELRKSIRGMS